jgi:outer membrane protein
MKSWTTPLLLFFTFTLSLPAQEKWGLERCIREALQNSLTLRQIELNQQSFEITGKQLRLERLPNLNLSSNAGVSFGRVINPATNDFETENSFYQSAGFSSGLMLFNGFRLRNSIRQNNVYTDAAREDVLQAENDLALNIALAYLNVLFAYENHEIATRRLRLTEQQLEQLDKLIQTGARPENDRYDLVAQIALDDQAVVTAQNNIEINLLSLKQQMWMEPQLPLEIERPEINLESLDDLENEFFQAVYDAALKTQPQIKAAELRQKASELGVDIARSQVLPSISIGGEIGSNWSDLAKEATDFTILRLAQPGVFINDEPVSFEVDTEIPTAYSTIPYFTQLDNNIGYGFGATLSIPIFNNYAARANIEKAKIDVINSDIESDKVKQTLRTNIQNALASAKAGRKSLDAAEASEEAARIALQNAERKAELGSINNFEYLTVRDRYDTAENNLLIARYEYYFRIKVIEYYMGRGIQLR